MRIKLVVLSLLFSLICPAQNENRVESFKATVLKTKTGVMIVYNGSEHALTIEIVSENIKHSEHPDVLMVENRVFQHVVLPSQNRINYDSLSIDRKKANLTSYVNYELNYIKQVLKSEILNVKFKWIELNGKLCLFWLYDMPLSNTSIEKQVYLTTIYFDNILTLNTAVTRDNNSLDPYLNLLTNAASSVKTFNAPIDLNTLKKDLNK